MIRLVVAFLALATPAYAQYTVPAPFHHAGGYTPRSCRAVDGDTIRCRLARTARTIRILRIDAPETNIACERERGLDAKAYLQQMLSGGNIYIREAVTNSRDVPGIPQPALDRYGRRLATVSVGGKDVAQTLIDLGKARVYNGGKRGPWPGCP